MLSKRYLWFICLYTFAIVSNGGQAATENSVVAFLPRGVITWTESNLQPQTTFLNHAIQIHDWDQYTVSNHILTPVKTRFVWVNPAKAHIQLHLGEVRINRVSDSPEEQVEMMIDGTGDGEIFQPTTTPDAAERWYQVKEISQRGDQALWAITLYGAHFDRRLQAWLIPSSISLEITTGLLHNQENREQDIQPFGQYLLNATPQQYFPNTTTSDLAGFSNGKLKLSVSQDGIYRVYYQDFKDSLDMNGSIASASISLTNKGDAIPIFVEDHGDGIFGNGDYFEFVGYMNRRNLPDYYYDPYSDVNVYWLDWGLNSNGLRLAEESGFPGTANPFRPTSFRTTHHSEKDSIFDRLGSVATNTPSFDQDHFFWETLNSGGSVIVPFSLPYPDRNSIERVNIRIGLTGLTYSGDDGNNGEHIVQAYINDQNIGSGTWHDQTEYVIASSDIMNLTTHLFNANTFQNALQLFAPVNSEPDRYDRVVMNWLEVDYDRTFAAHQNQLNFKKSAGIPSGLVEFEVKNLTSPDITIVKNGASIIRDFTVRPWEDQGVVTYSAIFQDHVSNSTPDYFVAGGPGILTPERIEPDTLANLRDANADYIIITNRRFQSAVMPLAEFKTTQGFQPLVVSIQDIYDEFNHGVAHAEAIRSFLRYGLNHWSLKPKFVLLVGDANTNPKASKNDFSSNYIPTFFIQTRGWGAAEADYYFSLLLNDDYIPDLHVGRLPCTSTEEVERVVNKLIHYESNPITGLWQNEILVIAGFEDTFKYQSESLVRSHIPHHMNFKRLYIDRDSEGQMYFGNTDTLVHDWNAGKLWINFMGHGGGAVWADRSLFTREDVADLTNTDALSFVTSMTCFTGGFANNNGLGEVALKDNDAGAIGWYGSSGVGWIINDYLLVQSLFKVAMNHDITLGEAIDLTRMLYFGAPNGYDDLKPSMLFQYNFLGDPSLRLAKATPDTSFQLDKSVYTPTESIVLECSAAFEGEWRYQVVGPSNVLIIDETAHLNIGPGNDLVIPLPADRANGLYRFSYTTQNSADENIRSGVRTFSINENWFEVTEMTEPVLPEQVYGFPTHFHSATTPDSIRLSIWGDYTETSMLALDAQNNWRKLSGLMINSVWQTIYYRYTAFLNGSIIANSNTYQLPLSQHENLALLDVKWGSVGNEVGLIVTVFNSAAEAIPNIVFHVSDSSQSGVNNFTKPFSGASSGTADYLIPMQRPPDSLHVTVTINSQLTEEMADNSKTAMVVPDAFQILPGVGLTFSGSSTDTIHAFNYHVFFSDATLDSSILGFKVLSSGPTGNSAVTIWPDSGMFSITPPTEGILISSSGQIFGQSGGLPVWERLRTATGSSDQYIVFKKLIIGCGLAVDQTAPEVEMMISGQRFFDGNYIAQNAELNLVCEDNAGFVWDSSSVEVWVDGVSQSVLLGDTTSTGQIMTVRSLLDLEPDEHEIQYRVRDALQNWTEMQTMNARVASSAEIMDFGNYPNPFQGQTYFVYELTRDFDELVIEIFTLAGHKIHQIDIYNALEDIPLNQIGYHEIMWRGVDRYGDFVANGVYFYRIAGRIGKKSIDGPIGKIVKIR